VNRRHKIILLLAVINAFIFPGADLCRCQNYDKTLKELDNREKESIIQSDKIKSSIKDKEKQKRELRIKETTLTGQLENINRELEKVKNELARLKTEIEVVRKQSFKAQGDLKVQQQEALKWNKTASREAGYLYRYGLHENGKEGLWLLNAISSKSFGDYIKQQKYMKAIISQKTAVLQKARKQCQVIIKLKESLESKEEVLSKLTGEQKKVQNDYEKKKEQQKILIEKIREQRKKVEIEIKELVRSAVSLQNMIDGLRTKKSEVVTSQEKANYVASTKGTLVWPVKGEVLSLFGKQPHPELPDTYVINKGIKISVSQGSSVSSVEKGNVLYANSFKGYGNMIILDHGKGFYSIYGQLMEFMVKENDTVEREQIIAKSGSIVYFEIRVDGKPEDPLNWLKQ